MRASTRFLPRCISHPNSHQLGTGIQVAAAIPRTLSGRDFSSRPSITRISPCSIAPTTLEQTLHLARYKSDYAQQAKDLNQQGLDEQESQLTDAIEQEKEKQVRAPWHREDTDKPPVARQRSAGAMTKGKLLTTPSRLLKLILPLTTMDRNSDRKDIEPLALLVHPQQPLSYLERLIQSELPTIKDDKGADKVPKVTFRARQADEDEIRPRTKSTEEIERETKQAREEEGEAGNEEAAKKEDGEKEAIEEEDRKEAKKEEVSKEVASETESTDGKPPDKSSKKEPAKQDDSQLGDGGVASYSGAGRESEEDNDSPFVRWSSSTEIGDFIRDAARAKEFEVEIENTQEPIHVAVPSFNDRTYYLRMRLRKTAKKLIDMAGIKKECDIAAHKGGQRVAMAGFGILAGWWYVVYRLTFETDLGWDTMEPVTYLVGLSTLMGGYLWFLYHNREVSYRSALNLTISRRQTKLYQQKGFDMPRWEALIEEGNALRREIKSVAAEYDVEWDERADEQDREVTKALKKDRDENKKESGKKKSKDNDDEGDD